mmetsp:Transcript_27855/g.61677  ORF Transcript_27855/g.61677 Transcript_27855/m.61677 type:complete len:202 (+) Transcript_27855:1157-1762(+)
MAAQGGVAVVPLVPVSAGAGVGADAGATIVAAVQSLATDLRAPGEGLRGLVRDDVGRVDANVAATAEPVHGAHCGLCAHTRVIHVVPLQPVSHMAQEAVRGVVALIVPYALFWLQHVVVVHRRAVGDVLNGPQAGVVILPAVANVLVLVQEVEALDHVHEGVGVGLQQVAHCLDASCAEPGGVGDAHVVWPAVVAVGEGVG